MTSVLDNTVLGKAFAAKSPHSKMIKFSLTGPLTKLTCSATKGFGLKSPFENSGIIIGRTVFTQRYKADYDGRKALLADVLVDDNDVEPDYFVVDADIAKWRSYRNGKAVTRINSKTGEPYVYKCGGVSFPDVITRPSRTIITGEGCRSASRTTHLIATNGRHRRLMPIELERLNMFPDNHTIEATKVKRGFLMGNALVVGIVELIGRQLAKEICFWP